VRKNRSVPQSERPEELRARSILERELGVQLVHADKTGGVDYRFTTSDGRAGAAEVTTLTSEQAKRANAAWMQLRAREYDASKLKSSWHAVVHQDRVRYSGLEEDLESALTDLEAAEVDEYKEPSSLELVIRRPEVREAVTILRSRAVSAAQKIATNDPSLRRIFISPMGGYTASGSNQSLELIEAQLAGKPDNAQKLDKAGVQVAHLFIWLDEDTPGEIARPFTGEPGTQWDHFGVPTREPVLPAPVTVLWVIHASTGEGWIWQRGVGWRAVHE
jgi:hypothetical protein